ncbi:MAG: prepilin-type N-terminal cleavage/methylation domain-containing protein, partial [Lysobacteraceae bacterium]
MRTSFTSSSLLAASEQMATIRAAQVACGRRALAGARARVSSIVRPHGFTLLEIIVVILIIAAVTGLAVG